MNKVTTGQPRFSPSGDYVEYLELCHREARKLGYLSTNSWTSLVEGHSEVLTLQHALIAIWERNAGIEGIKNVCR